MTSADQYYKKMTETPVSRLILKLGIPTTISMLITSIYNMADTYFVGSLGPSAQAATGVLFTLQAIIQGVAFMLGQGSGSFISKFLANKNADQASTYVSTAFFFGGAVGLTITVAGLIFLKPMVLFLGSTETILPHAMDYGFWVLTSCPFVICSMVVNNGLRYEGRAFYSMFGLTTGGLLNILGDYLLVIKLNMGVYGAGLATAVSQIISFVILLVMFRKMAQTRIALRFFSLDPKIILRICRVGIPSLIRQSLTSFTTGILNNMTKPFGDAAIAAMSVVNRYAAFLVCVGIGMGQGFQPVASFNYQARKYDRVKKGLVFVICFNIVFIGSLAAISLCFAEQIISIFQKKEEVIAIGSVALRLCAGGMLFLPFSIPMNMLYQSIQKAALSSGLSLLRSGGVTIPMLLIFVPLLGLTGVQIAQPVADIISGLASIPFVIHFLKTTSKE